MTTVPAPAPTAGPATTARPDDHAPLPALRVWALLARRRRDGSRLPDVLTVVAFAVVSAALAVATSGLIAFGSRDYAEPGTAGLYLVLATTACALMTVPILTLGGVAARLTTGRRNHRLATLRLLGATGGQARAVTVAETAVTGLVGGVLGLGLYAALLPVLALIPFAGRPFTVAELWLGGPVAALVVVAVVVPAVASAVISLAGVTISPLGVVARHRPGRLSVWRLITAVALLVLWPALLQVLPTAGGIALLVGTILMINIVGPYVIMLLGMIVAHRAVRPTTLLAARRIVDDPRQAWRTSSVVALVVVLSTLSAIAGALGAEPNADVPDLGADLATGSLLTLIIVAVLGATSSAVVLASRVIEQTDTHARLRYAGAPTTVLHRARAWEVGIPLLASLIMAGGFALMIMVPFSSLAGPGALLRFGLGVASGVVLTLASVAVSAPLVERSGRPGDH